MAIHHQTAAIVLREIRRSASGVRKAIGGSSRKLVDQLVKPVAR
jgi:hypothetical protein